MNDDKMRAEFEAWAESQCLSLTRINWDNGTISEYAYTATFDAWQVWQAAYAAGQKAEQAEVERLRHEVEFLKENRDAFMLLAGRMISDDSKLGGSND